MAGGIGRGREALQERQEGSGRPGKVGRPAWRDGKGQEVLREGQEGMAGPSGGPGGIGRGWESILEGREIWEPFLEGQEWSGGSPGGRGGGGWSPFGGPGRVERLSWRYGRGWKESRGPPSGLGGVRSPSRRAVRIESPSSRAGWDRESLLEGREGTGGPPEGSGVVGKHLKALPEGWAESGVFTGGPGGLGGSSVLT